MRCIRVPESPKTHARFRAKLRSGGRIQVPKEVRNSENLDDGDYVDVILRAVESPKKKGGDIETVEF